MFSKILNTFGTKTLSAVINLLVAVILSQHLGPEGKGIQSLILTTITFILVFANLVGGANLVYLVPRHKASLLIMPSYAWTLFTAAVAYGLLWFFPLIDRSFILHASILSVLNSLTSIHTSILIGRERIRAANYIGLVQPLILILSLAVTFMAYEKASVDNYVLSLYFSFTASLLVSALWFLHYCRPFAVHAFKEYAAISGEMVKYGILNQVAHVTQMLSFRLSYYVLDHYHGEAAVGVYSNGISLAESIWLIAKSISLVQYARISNLGNREEAAAFTARLSRVSTALSLTALLPLLLLPPGFYTSLFGEGFEGTKTVIWTLAFGVLMYNYPILIGHYFSGTGRYHVNAITSSIGLILSVILYFGLIPQFGQAGAGLATSISYFLTSLIFMIWFRKEYSKWYQMLILQREDFSDLKAGIRKILSRK